MEPIAPDRIRLGLLAGGLARWLGGLDKAWLSRDGVPQVERLAARFRGQVSQVLAEVTFDGVRLGNLDTHDDLRAAGIAWPAA